LVNLDGAFQFNKDRRTLTWSSRSATRSGFKVRQTPV